MRTLLLLSILLVTMACYAQENLEKLIGYHSNFIVKDAVTDIQGNILCLFRDDLSGYGSDFIPGVMKLDTSLNILWASEQHFPYMVTLQTCSPTSDKGVVMIGSGHDSSFLSHGFITKLDSSGNVLWSKMTHSDYFIESLNCVRAMPSGNLLVCGIEPGYLAIMKLNNAGNILWKEKISSPASTGLWAKHIDAAGDNNYYISGQVTDSNSHTGGLVMKIDTNGEVLWANIFTDGQASPFISSLVAGSDSAYYFTLDNYLNDTIAMVKAISSVSIPFAPAYYLPHSKQFYNSVSLDDSGNILVCGIVDSANLPTRYDIMLLTFSSDGFLLNSHRFNAGRNEFTTSSLVLQNSLFIVGSSSTLNFDSTYAYLIKHPLTGGISCNEHTLTLTAPPVSIISGSLIPFVIGNSTITLDSINVSNTFINPNVTELCGQTVIETIPQEELLSVFPNPFSEKCDLKNSSPEISTVKVFDLRGNQIVTQEINPFEKISLGKDFPDGVYLVEIITTEKISSIKVVKMK